MKKYLLAFSFLFYFISYCNTASSTAVRTEAVFILENRKKSLLKVRTELTNKRALNYVISYFLEDLVKEINKFSEILTEKIELISIEDDLKDTDIYSLVETGNFMLDKVSWQINSLRLNISKNQYKKEIKKEEEDLEKLKKTCTKEEVDLPHVQDKKLQIKKINNIKSRMSYLQDILNDKIQLYLDLKNKIKVTVEKLKSINSETCLPEIPKLKKTWFISKFDKYKDKL